MPGSPPGFRGGGRRRAERTWHADPPPVCHVEGPGCGWLRVTSSRVRNRILAVGRSGGSEPARRAARGPVGTGQRPATARRRACCVLHFVRSNRWRQLARLSLAKKAGCSPQPQMRRLPQIPNRTSFPRPWCWLLPRQGHVWDTIQPTHFFANRYPRE